MPNDFGGFDRQESMTTWCFWVRRPGYRRGDSVKTSGTSFMEAREQAAIKLGCSGQDLDSEIVKERV